MDKLFRLKCSSRASCTSRCCRFQNAFTLTFIAMDGAVAFVIGTVPLLGRPVKYERVKKFYGNNTCPQLRSHKGFFSHVQNYTRKCSTSPVDLAAQLDGFHEECGVIGIWGIESAAKYAFYGLHALQHRGQEGAGITVLLNEKLKEYKNLGLVTEVFNDKVLSELQGTAAIGHNRFV